MHPSGQKISSTQKSKLFEIGNFIMKTKRPIFTFHKNIDICIYVKHIFFFSKNKTMLKNTKNPKSQAAVCKDAYAVRKLNPF